MGVGVEGVGLIGLPYIHYVCVCEGAHAIVLHSANVVGMDIGQGARDKVQQLPLTQLLAEEVDQPSHILGIGGEHSSKTVYMGRHEFSMWW